jgi:hypothetical protein
MRLIGQDSECSFRLQRREEMFKMTKRIVVATAFGAVAGLLCYLGALMIGLAQDFDALRILNIFVHRTLIGFVIGISGLKMRWALHGLLIGTIVGLPFLVFDWIAGVEPMVLVAVLVLNAVFGVMIEFFTTKVFNAPVEAG